MKCKLCKVIFQTNDTKRKYCSKDCHIKDNKRLCNLRAYKYYWDHRNPKTPLRIMKPIPCKKCGEIKKHKGLGLCKKCHRELFENIHRFGGKKELIYKRDSFQCQHCGMTMDESLNKWNLKLSVHHFDKNIYNTSENNLITLCRSCHAKLHPPLRRTMK